MFWIKLIGAIFVAGAALLLFEKRLTAAIKDFLHDEVKIPTDHNSDELDSLSHMVHMLSDHLRLFGENQKADHEQIKHDNSKIMDAVKKIRVDQKKINKHDKILNHHTSLLEKHRADIKWIERTKADKKKRGKSK